MGPNLVQGQFEPRRMQMTWKKKKKVIRNQGSNLVQVGLQFWFSLVFTLQKIQVRKAEFGLGSGCPFQNLDQMKQAQKPTQPRLQPAGDNLNVRQLRYT